MGTHAAVATVVGLVTGLAVAGSPEVMPVATVLPVAPLGGDSAGSSLAVAGDVLAIGCPEDPASGGAAGAVRIYRWSGWDWDEETVLRPAANATGDRFGSAIALSQSRVVIGSPYDDAAGADAGAVHVYEYDDATGWMASAVIVSPTASAADHFGGAVAMDGDLLLIGARDADTAGIGSGDAWIFTIDGTGQWTTGASVLPPEVSAHDRFGRAVAMSGGVGCVGADRSDISQINAGSVWVLSVDGLGGEVLDLLQADEPQVSGEFGTSVAMFGSDIIVGAPRQDAASADTGAAFTYASGDGVAWALQGVLTDPLGEADDRFGDAVAISLDLATVGSPHRGGDIFRSGGGMLFRRDGSDQWVVSHRLISNAPGDRHRLGVALAQSADVLMAGAPGLDAAGTDAGGMKLFDLPVDCNENGVEDETDIADETSPDCNLNNVPDECDISELVEPDCNLDGVPDVCQIAGDEVADCDGNGVPDSCDVEDGSVPDCNVNAIPDSCDIANGSESDYNGNAVPDDCECLSDVNGDGVVNVNDLLMVVANWGTAGPVADVNFDGVVGVDDMLVVIDTFGPCP